MCNYTCVGSRGFGVQINDKLEICAKSLESCKTENIALTTQLNNSLEEHILQRVNDMLSEDNREKQNLNLIKSLREDYDKLSKEFDTLKSDIQFSEQTKLVMPNNLQKTLLNKLKMKNFEIKK